MTPSKRAEDATPNVELIRLPDISNIRSCSITLLELCVVCSGTMASWETSLVLCRVVAVKKYVVRDIKSYSSKDKYSRKRVQLSPFQNDKNAVEPSLDLV